MATELSNLNKDQTTVDLIESILKLNIGQITNLFQTIIAEHPKAYKTALEWLNRNKIHVIQSQSDQPNISVNEELLWEYWQDAQEIISSFNEYGGGDEEEEEQCGEILNKIDDLIKNNEFSTETKIELLDNIFEEYDVDNSGFEDSLMDLCHSICKTEEEWQYLIQKLQRYPSDWRDSIAMNIFNQYLHDHESYLALRNKHLKYGLDYWDLAQFYINNENQSKAFETAIIGLEKGEGNIEPLLVYLFEYYANINDTDNVEKIVQKSKRHNDYYRDMLNRLFLYYQKLNNYEAAKNTLLLGLDYVKSRGYINEVRAYAHYKKMKEYLNALDWEKIEPGIIKKIKEIDIEGYLQICMDKNLRKEVLDELLRNQKNPASSGDYWGNRLYDVDKAYDKFADQIANDFPNEIIEYFWKCATDRISGGDRKTYSSAEIYLKKVRDIYLMVLKDKAQWETRFTALKTEHKRRPAFIETVKDL